MIKGINRAKANDHLEYVLSESVSRRQKNVFLFHIKVRIKMLQNMLENY